MTFDVHALGKEALAEARALLEPKAKELGSRGLIILTRLRLLEEDIQATLHALENAPNEDAAQAYREDLVHFIPARKSALLSAVQAELGSAIKVTAETLLEIAIKVVVVAAKAFVPIP